VCETKQSALSGSIGESFISICTSLSLADANSRNLAIRLQYGPETIRDAVTHSLTTATTIVTFSSRWSKQPHRYVGWCVVTSISVLIDGCKSVVSCAGCVGVGGRETIVRESNAFALRAAPSCSASLSLCSPPRSGVSLMTKRCLMNYRLHFNRFSCVASERWRVATSFLSAVVLFLVRRTPPRCTPRCVFATAAPVASRGQTRVRTMGMCRMCVYEGVWVSATFSDDGNRN